MAKMKLRMKSWYYARKKMEIRMAAVRTHGSPCDSRKPKHHIRNGFSTARLKKHYKKPEILPKDGKTHGKDGKTHGSALR